MAAISRVFLRAYRAISDRERLRTFPRDDEGPPRNCDRRERGRDRLAALRIQMETGRRDARARLVRAASAAARLADVVSPRSDRTSRIRGSFERRFVYWKANRMSRGSSRAIRSRSVRRATFAQLFIAIVSRQPPNMDNQARGGNDRNSANTCRRSRSSNFAKIDVHNGDCLLFREACGLIFVLFGKKDGGNQSRQKSRSAVAIPRRRRRA